MVAIMNSWIVTVYPSTLWKLICSTCQFSFPLSATPDWTFLWATRWVFSRRAEDACPADAPGPCSQFLVFLICICYLVCMILVTICSLLRVSVFRVWCLSLDFDLLITAITLVPLIALKQSTFLLTTKQMCFVSEIIHRKHRHEVVEGKAKITKEIVYWIMTVAILKV